MDAHGALPYLLCHARGSTHAHTDCVDHASSGAYTDCVDHARLNAHVDSVNHHGCLWCMKCCSDMNKCMRSAHV